MCSDLKKAMDVFRVLMQGDKDAPAAVCMLCEVAAFYKSQGKTLLGLA